MKKGELKFGTRTVELKDFSEMIHYLDKNARKLYGERLGQCTFKVYTDHRKRGRYHLCFDQVQDKTGKWVPKEGKIAKSVYFWNPNDGGRISLEHCFHKNGRANNELFNGMYQGENRRHKFYGFESIPTLDSWREWKSFHKVV